MIYLWVSNFRQTGQTLEALKEEIRQEVAAITPEMILKVMDYRERLHQCINNSRPLLERCFIKNTLM